MLCPVGISFRSKGKIKTFLDTRNVSVFVTSRLALNSEWKFSKQKGKNIEKGLGFQEERSMSG